MDKRERMVEEIKSVYKLKSPKVLSVMLRVPRHKFVLEKYADIAYTDAPVPIGYDQTMSQPYTVAFMTHLLNLKGNEKVLEVGTGSGYQSAILSRLSGYVHTIEVIPELAEGARKKLKELGYDNVEVIEGSGEWGWESKSPYDAIIITAGLTDKVPDELFDQLKDKGVLVAPIGKSGDKVMTRFIKKKDGRIKEEKFGIFHFVPFIHQPN